METKYCPTCGHIMVETTAGAYCPNTSCASREFRFDTMPEPLLTNEPIIISRACPKNCPGNIPEAKTRALIEAARNLLNAVTVLCGDEYSCFSTCSLANECDKDSGNECLLVARLKAALEEEG